MGVGASDGRVLVDVKASARAPGLGPGPGLEPARAETAGLGSSRVMAARRRDSASVV